jgi:hypothetical protein
MQIVEVGGLSARSGLKWMLDIRKFYNIVCALFGGIPVYGSF